LKLKLLTLLYDFGREFWVEKVFCEVVGLIILGVENCFKNNFGDEFTISFGIICSEGDLLFGNENGFDNTNGSGWFDSEVELVVIFEFKHEFWENFEFKFSRFGVDSDVKFEVKESWEEGVKIIVFGEENIEVFVCGEKEEDFGEEGSEVEVFGEAIVEDFDVKDLWLENLFLLGVIFW